MTTQTRTSRDMLADLISDLTALQERDPAEVVNVLSSWVANDGSPSSIRSRVSTVRRLAAAEAWDTIQREHEATGRQPDQRVISNLADRFGCSIAGAYLLIRMGREAR